MPTCPDGARPPRLAAGPVQQLRIRLLRLTRRHQHVDDAAERVQPFQGAVVVASAWHPHPAAVRTAQLVQLRHQVRTPVKPRQQHLATPARNRTVPQLDEQVTELPQRRRHAAQVGQPHHGDNMSATSRPDPGRPSSSSDRCFDAAHRRDCRRFHPFPAEPPLYTGQPPRLRRPIPLGAVAPHVPGRGDPVLRAATAGVSGSITDNSVVAVVAAMIVANPYSARRSNFSRAAVSGRGVSTTSRLRALRSSAGWSRVVD